MVAADDAVITQVDNGRPAPDGTGREVTSSSSDRRVVSRMLELLDAHPGEQVLEIGTGDGWNAGILAAAGCEVTTIEVDAQVAGRARRRLVPAVRAVVGDGMLGVPERGPYDRVIATVGVRSVPWEWCSQVRDGGRVLAPLTRPWSPPGLVSVTRAGDRARGRIEDGAVFMAVRAEQVSRRREHATGPQRESATELHPYWVLDDPAGAVAVGQRVGDVTPVWGGDTSWCYAADGSWAAVDVPDGESPPYEVTEVGPRSVWAEVLEAYRWWDEHGRPGVEDWVVTVEPGGQRIEIPPEA